MECLSAMHGLLSRQLSRLTLQRSARLHTPCLPRVCRSFSQVAVLDSRLRAFPRSSDMPDPTQDASTLKERIRARQHEAASDGETLEQAQQKSKHLRGILKTLRWPRLSFFTADGLSYGIPWPTKPELPIVESVPAMHTLRYLSGFFDGDGCVTCDSKLSGCRLSVCQSYDKAEVLILFCRTLGGSIRRHRDGVGLQKPTLEWVIRGAPARRSANLLAIHSIVKNRQLVLAASWPDDVRTRLDCKASLLSLKHCDSAVAGRCTWEYAAGFFDAEGHVHLQHPSTLQLRMGQRFATVLHCLREFLAHSCDVKANVHAGNGHFLLIVSQTSACKSTLQNMLNAGLLVKKQSAEVALTTTNKNAAQARLALAKLVGNQMFGKRLDDAGIDRARKITAILRKIRVWNRKGNADQAAAALRDVQQMKLQHKLLNAMHENQCLTEYVRKMQTLRRAENSQSERLLA